VALGAIVAPPDAAAATAVLKQLRPPHRLLVILEGESLFNDASALLVYRLAVAVAMGQAFSAARAVPLLALVCAGSVVLGAVLSRISIVLNRRVGDVATAVLLQFLSTFFVWMLAERLHLSGIITMVVFAILVARTAPAQTPARLRIPSYAVWEVAVFVLNVLAFIIIGLQLRPILGHLGGRQLAVYLATAGAVCAAVVAARLVWVMGYAVVGHGLRQLYGGRLPRPPFLSSMRSALVVAWCGMRGIVTLAAALALPPAFPHRDLILFASFAVVLVTLVIQGMTLSPLMRLLRLKDDGLVGREIGWPAPRPPAPAWPPWATPAPTSTPPCCAASWRTASGAPSRPPATTRPPTLPAAWKPSAGPSAPSAAPSSTCAPAAPSATTPSTASRRSWTGPS
jgi:CPA1 family monovalent cation:H+ antiporter